MRRLLCGVVIIVGCGAAGAVDITLDARPTIEALGLGELQSELLPGLSNISIDVPLPGSVDGALPNLRINENNGLDITPGINSMPELPGLGSLPELVSEVELPGLDGLPIQVVTPPDVNAPRIPGIDGLPLGFGRR